MANPQELLDRLDSYEEDYKRYRRLFENDGDVEESQQQLLDRIDGMIFALRKQLAQRRDDATSDDSNAQKESSGRSATQLSQKELKAGIPNVKLSEISADALKVAARQSGASSSELRDVTGQAVEQGRDVVEGIGGAVVGGVVVGVAAAKEAKAAAVKLIEILKEKFDDLRKEQFCIVTVLNDTDDELERVDEGFHKKRGGWHADKFPPRKIAPRGFANFIAKSPENFKLRGVDGFVKYAADGATWTINFSNPRLKITNASVALEGDNKDVYVAPKPLHGVGDVAHFDFVLGLENDDNPSIPAKGDDNGGDDNGGDKGDDDEKKPSGVDAQASCLVTVTNNTSSVLTLVDQGHERGDFMTFADGTLQPGSSCEFVSVETPDNDDRGCKGFVVWQVGEDNEWRVEWDNPEQEKNTTTSTLSGSQAKTFRELDQIGQGDENVPTKFTISESGQPAVPPVGPGSGGDDDDDDDNGGDDKACEGFTVLVRQKETGKKLEGVSVTVGKQSDTTSSNGLATVELPVGKHDYEAAKEGFESLSGNVDIIAGDNPELILEMAPAKDKGPCEGLTILVRNVDTGKAIENAEVKIGEQSDTTSSLGLATVELPVGKHKYEASATDYEVGKGEHEIIAGDNPELIIDLKPKGDGKTHTLTVVVKDRKTSDAIKDADVKVGSKSDTTSALGLATLELPAGKHAYEATAKTYKEEKGSVEVVEGDNKELVIELTKDDNYARSSLAVIVLDDDTSAPIPAATVKVGDKTEQTSGAGLVVVTIEPGTHDYEVSARDYTSKSDKVEVEEGDDNELTVRLKKDSSNTSVTLTVTDIESGDPIGGAAITLDGKPGVTDASGDSKFEVEPGKLSYSVTKNGFEEASGSVEAKPDANTNEAVELQKLDEFVPPTEENEPTLRKGDDNVDGWVEYMQKMLNYHLENGTVPENGKFDRKTFDAVKQFQGSTDPPCLVDGIVGNESWSALREDPQRAAVGTDERPPGTFVETGAEGRWGTESEDIMTYDKNRDELRLVVMSVGDQSIDEFEADVFINGDRRKIKIGAPEVESSTGAGHAHWVRVTKFVAKHGPGPYDIEAFLPQELGGDKWTTTGLELPGGGGSTRSG